MRWAYLRPRAHCDREEGVWIVVEGGTGPRVGTAGDTPMGSLAERSVISAYHRTQLRHVLASASPLTTRNYLENAVTPSELPPRMGKSARPVVGLGVQLSRRSSRS
jgi:hypothetical protein